MSILDGESQVERDLGCMKAYFKRGKGRCNEDLLDDLLILKLCGPQAGEEAGGTFAVQCAEQWRKHIGFRKLCESRAQRQPAAPRRKIKRDSFAEARRAVLLAGVRAHMQRCDNEMTAFGVKADLPKPPPNESGGYRAALNEDLKEFDKLSQSYKNQNWRSSSFGRAAFPKFTVRDSANQRMLPDYSRIKLLAFLPEGGEAASGAIADGYAKTSSGKCSRTQTSDAKRHFFSGHKGIEC